MKLLNFKIASLLLLAFLATQVIFVSRILAQKSERYPTDQELEATYTKFTNLIKRNESSKVGSKYIRDRRTASEEQSLQSFIKRWSVVAPQSAPFLGSWQGYEDTITIYPSKTKGQVCIVNTGEGRGRFFLGNISNGKVFTTEYTILFRQGRYLGIAGINSNYGGDVFNGNIPHHSPQPLIQPAEFLRDRIRDTPQGTARSQISEILEKYRDAGCTASLPNG